MGSMVDMKEVRSSSFEPVFSSHNIEHLYPHELELALSEFHRVLQNAGFLIITCPDLENACPLIGKDPLTEPTYHSPADFITPLDILLDITNLSREAIYLWRITVDSLKGSWPRH